MSIIINPSMHHEPVASHAATHLAFYYDHHTMHRHSNKHHVGPIIHQLAVVHSACYQHSLSPRCQADSVLNAHTMRPTRVNLEELLLPRKCPCDLMQQLRALTEMSMENQTMRCLIRLQVQPYEKRYELEMRSVEALVAFAVIWAFGGCLVADKVSGSLESTWEGRSNLF